MVYKIDVFNVKGEKVKERELNEKIFNEENINNSLVHEFVLLQLANSRNPIAHTKTRAEVAMSGRKLYAQKGSGRARSGDAGAPQRRHGGVTFGPRNNVNYTKHMPKAMRRKALVSALTLKAKDSEIICLDNYDYSEIKTKNAVLTLNNLGLGGQKTLFVIPSLKDVYVNSFRNIEKVKYLLVDFVNPYDLLTHKNVLFLEESLNKLEERLSK